MSVAIKISVNVGLYLKEPQNSTLGKKILKKDATEEALGFIQLQKVYQNSCYQFMINL